MQIDKMVTIDNNHISCDTMLALHIEPWVQKFWFIQVYPKGEYGKFILINVDEFKQIDETELRLIPEDLRDVLQFAVSKKCSVLCLDTNGDRVAELKYYDD